MVLIRARIYNQMITQDENMRERSKKVNRYYSTPPISVDKQKLVFLRLRVFGLMKPRLNI